MELDLNAFFLLDQQAKTFSLITEPITSLHFWNDIGLFQVLFRYVQKVPRQVCRSSVFTSIRGHCSPSKARLLCLVSRLNVIALNYTKCSNSVHPRVPQRRETDWTVSLLEFHIASIQFLCFNLCQNDGFILTSSQRIFAPFIYDISPLTTSAIYTISPLNQLLLEKQHFLSAH